MYKPFSIFVGLRYTRAKRKNHFISFISLMAMLGIMVGDTALITVMSVMNGFEKEIRAQILGMASHATITGGFGSQVKDWETADGIAKKHPDVVGSAPFIEREVMLSHGKNVSGAQVRGVLPDREREVSEIMDNMVAGDFERLTPGDYNIVLGGELAYTLGVSLGDKVTVIAPQVTTTAAGMMPRFKRFTVTGIFTVGNSLYDRGLVYFAMADAAKLFRMEDDVTGIRLKLTDMMQSFAVSKDITRQLPGIYRISDWRDQNRNYFRAVAMEKAVMFIILTLVVAVAAFNIVSTLVMVVTDKESDIAILRTFGASPATIMKIFFVQGSVIGVVGTIIGVGVGVLLASNIADVIGFLEATFGFKILDPAIYYISEVPSDMRWPDVARVGVISLVLSFVATLYPAWRASRTEPAEALRYE